MKKFPLILIVLVVAGALVGLDYWFNFYGKGPILYTELISDSPEVSIDPVIGVQDPSLEVDPVIIPPVFSGSFPLIMSAVSQEFPYTIATQQRVFDLFGVFNLNGLPGVQILRYDVVPLDSASSLSPMQVYELSQANQSSGITFLSLKTHLFTQVDSAQFNEVEGDYASNILFYNPVIAPDNAFVLTENSVVLGFVYPRESVEIFETVKKLMRNVPDSL